MGGTDGVDDGVDDEVDLQDVDDEAEAEAEGPPPSTFAWWDIWDEDKERKRPLRQLPSIVWSATRFVWRADQFSSLITVGNDVVSALASAAQVLVVGALLSRLVSDQPVDDAVRDAAPWVAALVVTELASNLLNAVVRGRAELFQERVGLAASKRILTVASNVDLLSFESPAFFDRLQRVQAQSVFRPIQVVQSTNMLRRASRGRWASWWRCSCSSRGWCRRCSSRTCRWRSPPTGARGCSTSSSGECRSSTGAGTTSPSC